MERTYNIKWRSADEEQLRKAVKNYNAKLGRLAKKNPEIKSSLPEKMTVKELKSIIVTRADFNREVNSLKRFSNRGAEDMFIILDSGETVKSDVYQKNPEKYSTTYGTKITRWEKNEINRRVPIINKRRQQEKEKIENIEAVYKGEKLGYKQGDVGMGSNLLNALKPINGISRGMNTKDVKMKLRDLRRQSQSGYFDKRTAILRDNYIKGLKDNYSETDVGDIIDHIEGLSDEEFLNTFYQEKNASMEIASPKRQNKHIEQENVTALRSAWLGEVEKI